MSTFKPTDEQLFDFFLRETDPVETQQIREYLKSHPEDAEILDEYHRVSSSFRSFPLESPAEDVLEQVRHQARVHLKKSFWHTITEFLQVRPQLAYGSAMVLVLALGISLYQLRDGTQTQFAALTKSASNSIANGQDPQALASHKNQDNSGQAGTGILPLDVSKVVLTPEEIESLNLKYAQAKDLMAKSLFIEAATIFENIVTTYPDFAQRVELYSSWIECLDKTGQKESAKLRRTELAKILRETRPQ